MKALSSENLIKASVVMNIVGLISLTIMCVQAEVFGMFTLVAGLVAAVAAFAAEMRGERRRKVLLEAVLLIVTNGLVPAIEILWKAG